MNTRAACSLINKLAYIRTNSIQQIKCSYKYKEGYWLNKKAIGWIKIMCWTITLRITSTQG